MGCGTQAANKAIKTILMGKSILMEKSGDAEKGLEVSLKKNKTGKVCSNLLRLFRNVK